MRHGTRQLSGERARHGAWHPATGLVLHRRVAGFYSAVDTQAAFAEHRSWRGPQWHTDETYDRVGGRWRYHLKAVDQFGQLIELRLTARWNAEAERAFQRQARQTARHYQPLRIVADKAHN
ncbi:DDE-type integrase/transposase/recombinase [Roseovarius sp. SK2]|uniref:DDE-type integrase/transposase/recombinase n=1 Tax=Roseovarius sp. SK2 TaxID=3028381 RepID=UPI003FD00259